MVSLGLSATVVRTALVAESVTISRVDSKDHHLQFSGCTFKVKTGENMCDNTLSTYVLYMLPTTLCVSAMTSLVLHQHSVYDPSLQLWEVRV